jgi:hypothetical protein
MQAALEADNQDFENGIPDAQPTPQVLPRAERKQVESAVKEDSKAVLHDELNKLLIDFRKGAEFELEKDLEGVDGAELQRAFATFAAVTTGDDLAWRDMGTYTLERIARLRRILDDGIPEEALAILRDVIAAPMTPEEATAHAAEKLRDYKYKCGSARCGHVFDEEPEKKNGKLQCPKCFVWKVEQLAETAVKE